MAKVFFEMQDYSIKAWYQADVFNQKLIVGISSGTKNELQHLYINDAISDAYEHYNRLNPDAQMIHPSAVCNE